MVEKHLELVEYLESIHKAMLKVMETNEIIAKRLLDLEKKCLLLVERVEWLESGR